MICTYLWGDIGEHLLRSGRRRKLLVCCVIALLVVLVILPTDHNISLLGYQINPNHLKKDLLYIEQLVNESSTIGPLVGVRNNVRSGGLPRVSTTTYTEKHDEVPVAELPTSTTTTTNTTTATTTISDIEEEIIKNIRCFPFLPQNTKFPEPYQNDCSSPHAIINDHGRLGNNICQYAHLYLLRHIFGIRVYMTKKMKKKLDPLFKNLSIPVEDPKCASTNRTKINYQNLYAKLYANTLNNARTNGSSTANSPSLLDGTYFITEYPCVRSMLLNYRDTIRKELTHQDDILKKAKGYIEKAMIKTNRNPQNTTLITVHIRRTDYIQYVKEHYDIPGLTKSYFKKAFDYYRKKVKNPVFAIVSDDQPWCRENLQSSDVVVTGSANSPEIDNAILSLGEHHVISYGTFGFTGTLLGKGTVIHPNNKTASYRIFECTNEEDYVPMMWEV